MMDAEAKAIAPGTAVTMTTAGGEKLGVAFFNPHTLISARMLARDTDLVIDRERVRTRHRMVDEADYFALLGVRRDASSFEVQRAFEAARRDFSPESFPPELRRELARELDEIGRSLDEAYWILRDDQLRARYAANLLD